MTTTHTAAVPPAVDLGGIKARQQLTRSGGDFAVIGTTLQLVGEQRCETADLRSGSTVLDIAAGNGDATLAAARVFALTMPCERAVPHSHIVKCLT